MKIEIRQERNTDHVEVYEINQNAFGQDTEAKLVELLRHSEAFIPELSLVALLNNKIVGHILFTKIKIKDDYGNEYSSLALAPMAVTLPLQKQGIGGQLIMHGISKARELGHNRVMLWDHKTSYPNFD